jgi:hypothetical protein
MITISTTFKVLALLSLDDDAIKHESVASQDFVSTLTPFDGTGNLSERLESLLRQSSELDNELCELREIKRASIKGSKTNNPWANSAISAATIQLVETGSPARSSATKSSNS